MLRVGNEALFTTVSHLFEEFEAANRVALAVAEEGNSTVRSVFFRLKRQLTSPIQTRCSWINKFDTTHTHTVRRVLYSQAGEEPIV